MVQVLSAPVGLSLWLDVAFGLLLAVSLIVIAELLARYAAGHAKRVKSHAVQAPAPSRGEMGSEELLVHP